MVKNYCETHHLYYKGTVCPLCEKEKLEKLVNKNKTKERNKKSDDKIEITEDLVSKLQKHFNK